jgi:hypothetical protein
MDKVFLTDDHFYQSFDGSKLKDFTYAELYNNAVMKINNWADICHNTDPIKEVDDSSNSYDKRLLLM